MTDDSTLDRCESEEVVSMDILGSDSDDVAEVSSVECDRPTGTADSEVALVKPVDSDIPLSLLDDIRIPDGCGMRRRETGGVSPKDTREENNTKALLLSTLSEELTVITGCSGSVVSIGSGKV